MMFNRIKQWLKDLSNQAIKFGDDVTVEIARDNYQKYQDELKQQGKDYIKSLCAEIKRVSRNGCNSIETESSWNPFMTKEFFIELKEYFEQRGFQVVEKSNSSGCISRWLEISWN